MEIQIKQSMKFAQSIKASQILALIFLALILAPEISAQNSQLRPRVIVFVHGIHGNRNSFRAANNADRPDLVRSDPHFAYSDVEVAEYPTPDSNGKSSSAQLAEYLFTSLKKDHVWEHDEVVFLAHSLGGILVEEMLLKHPGRSGESPFHRFVWNAASGFGCRAHRIVI